MKVKSLIIVSSLLALSACGSDETKTSENNAPTKETKAQKFKGAKFAPSKETMSYWAGIGTAQKKKYISLRHPELKSTCRWHGPQNYWRTPKKIDDECRKLFDGFATKAVFEPNECFEGLTEGSHEFSDLINIVSCNGKIDSPIGYGQMRLVLHKVNDEWFGFTEGYVGWTAR